MPISPCAYPSTEHPIIHSIQFAGAVGVSNCPGAPQLDFFLGTHRCDLSATAYELIVFCS